MTWIALVSLTHVKVAWVGMFWVGILSVRLCAIRLELPQVRVVRGGECMAFVL